MRKHLILYTIFDPEIVKKTNFENDKNGEAVVSFFRRLGFRLNYNKNYRHMIQLKTELKHLIPVEV